MVATLHVYISLSDRTFEELLCNFALFGRMEFAYSLFYQPPRECAFTVMSFMSLLQCRPNVSISGRENDLTIIEPNIPIFITDIKPPSRVSLFLHICTVFCYNHTEISFFGDCVSYYFAVLWLECYTNMTLLWYISWLYALPSSSTTHTIDHACIPGSNAQRIYPVPIYRTVMVPFSFVALWRFSIVLYLAINI